MLLLERTEPFISHLFWWIVLLPLSPFALCFLGLLLFWKHGIVGTLAKFVFSKSSKSLNSFDAVLAADSFDKEPLSVVGKLLVVEGKFDFAQFCAHLIKTILEARGTSNQLVYQKMLQVPREFWGYFFWEAAEDFHIKNHVTLIERPVTESDLRQYVEDCVKAPFPPGKPVWEIRVLSNYQTDPPSAIPLTVLIFRLHHVIADGYTLVKLLDRLMGNVSASYQPKPKEASFGKGLSLFFSAPSIMVHLCWNAMRHRDWFTQGKVSRDFVISWKFLPLELLKSIRKKTGVRFATLGIFALSGALKKHAAANKAQNVRDCVRVCLPLPLQGHPVDKMANHWTAGFIKVPLDDETMTRLTRTEQEVDSVLASNIPTLSRWMGPPMLSLLPNFLLHRFLNYHQGIAILFSSVPGPSHKELWIRNNRVRSIVLPTGPQYAQTGIFGNIYTYNDKAALLIAVNKDICPTSQAADQICNYFEEELQQLLFDDRKSKESCSVVINEC